jgi:hypothetical protein
MPAGNKFFPVHVPADAASAFRVWDGAEKTIIGDHDFIPGENLVPYYSPIVGGRVDESIRETIPDERVPSFLNPRGPVFYPPLVPPVAIALIPGQQSRDS